MLLVDSMMVGNNIIVDDIIMLYEQCKGQRF